jgi:pimeloyl-ACP methyl ester carboxylesterase
VVLLGHSIGGAIAVNVAARNPQASPATARHLKLRQPAARLSLWRHARCPRVSLCAKAAPCFEYPRAHEGRRREQFRVALCNSRSFAALAPVAMEIAPAFLGLNPGDKRAVYLRHATRALFTLSGMEFNCVAAWRKVCTQRRPPHPCTPGAGVGEAQL